MRIILFMLFVSCLWTESVYAVTYEIKITPDYPEAEAMSILCSAENETCFISVPVSENEIVDVAADVTSDGIIKFMFMHERQYVPVVKVDGRTWLNVRLDEVNKAHKMVKLYRTPLQEWKDDDMMGLHYPPLRTGKDILSHLGISVAEIEDR